MLVVLLVVGIWILLLTLAVLWFGGVSPWFLVRELWLALARKIRGRS